MLHLVFFDEDKGRTFDYKRENAFGLFSLSSIPLRSIPEREKRKVLHLLIELKVFTNQFMGMTEKPFLYEDFERTREKLVQVLREALTEIDRTFIINFENVSPDWSSYDFEKFPAIQWKLQNLHALKKNNPEKHSSNVKELERLLFS